MHPLHTALRSTKIMQGSMHSYPKEVGLCANHVARERGRSGEKQLNTLWGSLVRSQYVCNCFCRIFCK